MATFYSSSYRSVDTAAASAVTSTSDSTIILSLLVANKAGTSACDVTASLNNNGTIKSYLGYTIPVPADSNVDLIANKLILPSGNSIAFSASTSGQLDVTVSYVVV